MIWRKARFGFFRYSSGCDRIAPTFPRLVGQRFPWEDLVQCGIVFDSDRSGQYLLAVELVGEKTGIYAVSISEKKCVPLLPGVVTFTATFAPDGKSFLFAVALRGEVTIFRQPWSNGKVIGTPHVALKVPFAFPLAYQGGNAYAFSRDLSTTVYAHPGGHADLYLLSQK